MAIKGLGVLSNGPCTTLEDIDNALIVEIYDRGWTSFKVEAKSAKERESQLSAYHLEKLESFEKLEFERIKMRERQLSAYHELALIQVAPQLFSEFTVSNKSNCYEFLVYIEKVRLKLLIRYSWFNLLLMLVHKVSRLALLVLEWNVFPSSNRIERTKVPCNKSTLNPLFIKPSSKNSYHC
jgi:hypothetical protein